MLLRNKDPLESQGGSINAMAELKRRLYTHPGWRPVLNLENPTGWGARGGPQRETKNPPEQRGRGEDAVV